MESKVIKISAENYKWLLTIASELQKKEERRVSFNEALKLLREENKNSFGILRKELNIWEEAGLEDSEAFSHKNNL